MKTSKERIQISGQIRNNLSIYLIYIKMIRYHWSFKLLCVIVLLLYTGCKPHNYFRKFKYLGQKPPYNTGEAFAPGIVSTDSNLEIGCTWSPDGKEFYFMRQSESGGTMYRVSYSKEGWSAPEEVEHFKKYPGFEPSISPDGTKFFYTRFTMQPSGSAADTPPVNIWVMDKRGRDLSEPDLLVPGMFCSAAANGNLYVTSTNGDKQGICLYRYENDGYSTMELLEGGVNSPVTGAHPCIAPDESFIVFDSKRSEDPEDTDLFVSFRLQDGAWSEAVNLGSTVNTKWNDICPSLSPDGKYLFYMSKADIYWVSTDIISEAKALITP